MISVLPLDIHIQNNILNLNFQDFWTNIFQIYESILKAKCLCLKIIVLLL